MSQTIVIAAQWMLMASVVAVTTQNELFETNEIKLLTRTLLLSRSNLTNIKIIFIA